MLIGAVGVEILGGGYEAVGAQIRHFVMASDEIKS